MLMPLVVECELAVACGPNGKPVVLSATRGRKRIVLEGRP